MIPVVKFFREKYKTIFTSLFFFMGIAWSSWLNLNSPGTPVQDEIGHLLISQHAWVYPEWILNVWGRPLNTLLFMPVSLLGLTAARFFSLFLSCLIVIIACQLAHELGVRNSFWVVLFLWFQPWFNSFSFIAITEVPFSLFLISGVYFSIRKRENIASIFWALLPLIRHEGIALLGIWVVYLVIRRKWMAIGASTIPMVIYNLIYYIVFNKFASSIFTNVKPTEIYGQGSWFHFVIPTIESVGVIITILAVLSIFQFGRLRAKILFLIPFVAYFVIHTFIYRFGLFASGGYQFFLLPLAPAFAITAGLGIEHLVDVCRKILSPITISYVHKVLTSTLAVSSIVLVGFVLQNGFISRGYPLSSEQEAAKEAANWLHALKPEGKIVSTHVWFHYYYGLRWDRGEYWIPEQEQIRNLKRGDLIVWDDHYSDRWGLKLLDLTKSNSGWEKLAEFNGGVFVIFRNNRN